jgi:hypothetical protein
MRYCSNKTALAMIFKLAEAAEKSWRRLDGHNQFEWLPLTWCDLVAQNPKAATSIAMIPQHALALLVLPTA